jgi:hypothetical protein
MSLAVRISPYSCCCALGTLFPNFILAYCLALNSASLLEVPAEFLCFVKVHQLHLFRRLICVVICRKDAFNCNLNYMFLRFKEIVKGISTDQYRSVQITDK